MHESNQSSNLPHDMDTPSVWHKKWSKHIAVIIVAGATLSGGYVFVKKSGAHPLAGIGVAGTAPSGVNLSPDEQKKQVAEMMASVGKIMLLPKGDEPVLARVEDPDALMKQQAFFTGAEKGDALLIFPKAQRAILYSPRRKLIINSGPIIAGSQSGQGAEATASAGTEVQSTQTDAASPVPAAPIPKKK